MNHTLLPQLHPLDEHNQSLADNVHPADWQNPKADGRYNLVVIGAGTAGLVTAAGAAGLGARVALIERELMGGDCLNVGCVPSKGMIRAARAVAAVRRAGEFGVQNVGDAHIDFGVAMERMRRLRAQISPLDSAARFRDLGVDVYFGEAGFADSDTIEIAGQRLRFSRAVIASGARAAAPPINGLDQVDYFTNETIFSLTELPPRLGIIGAGPIGCEMAQTFARFGSEVHLVESSANILPREDPQASAIVRDSLVEDGVNILCGGRQLQLSRSQGRIRMLGTTDTCQYDQLLDKLLVAVGRAANVESLGLEKVGVKFDRAGVAVNDRLQTTNPRIFAAGDVCSRFKFTHAADFMARTVIQNALFQGRKKVSSLLIPWCTYTSPEIAHVGYYEKDAQEHGIELDSYVQDFADVDRAILDGEVHGLVKVHVKRGTDNIVGGTIVAEHAGDMISELTLAMQHGIGLRRIGATIHPYPTQAEAIRKLGDQYNRSRLTPRIKWAFAKWLAWNR